MRDANFQCCLHTQYDQGFNPAVCAKVRARSFQWWRISCHSRDQSVSDGGVTIDRQSFRKKTSQRKDSCSAGVGFIVSPHCRRCVVNFCPEFCCQASLKLRVPGWKTEICNLYTPDSGKPFDERPTLFQAAAHWINSLFRHGPLLALADFNVRLRQTHGRIACEWPTHFGQQECTFQC